MTSPGWSNPGHQNTHNSTRRHDRRGNEYSEKDNYFIERYDVINPSEIV